MKKMLWAAMALGLLCACNGKQEGMKYHGLAMDVPAAQFVDSLAARGFAVDSAASDSGRTVVLKNPGERYTVIVAVQHDELLAVQENYTASTNDSTRQLWQQLRDGLEKELDAWPDCPMLKDDHKIARFDTGNGIIVVTLENTYAPSLQVLYERARQ